MRLESERFIYRETTFRDMDYVLLLERDEENIAFICSSSREEHLSMLDDKDIMHFIIVSKQSDHPIGFLLLSGLLSTNNSLEFRRLIIAEKGYGYGREVLKMIKNFCLNELKFRRLWLDVFDFNYRAIALYQSEGFKISGVREKSVPNNGQLNDLTEMEILENE